MVEKVNGRGEEGDDGISGLEISREIKALRLDENTFVRRCDYAKLRR
jgi:hypothetical protein